MHKRLDHKFKRPSFDSTALPNSLKTRSFSDGSSSTVATSTPSSLAMEGHNSEKMGQSEEEIDVYSCTLAFSSAHQRAVDHGPALSPPV